MPIIYIPTLHKFKRFFDANIRCMAITVAQLKTFAAVEHTGSIKAAAAELVVTQPSVSGAVSALEREVGARLVERHGRGVRLTAAGEAFAPFAARVLALIEEGRAAAEAAADPDRQELRIAAVNTAGEYIVPPLLKEFRRLHPEVDVRLEVGNRAQVFRRLELRDADVGIGGTPPESGELKGVPFLDNEHLVLASPEHPLSGRRRIAVGDLEDATWLLRESGSGTRAFVTGLLSDWRIKPSLMTIGSNGAIKQSVMAGLGISIQSRWAVSLELSAGLLAELDVEATLPRRKWHALCPAEAGGRPSTETFLRFLSDATTREALGKLLATHPTESVAFR